jgi:RimJ/RimL family protein N-acetyltransferase
MAEEVVLTGRFVQLRPLRVEDAAMTVAWRTGERARLLNQGALNAGQQAEWISSRPPNEHNFLICLMGGRPVGMLSITGIDLVNRRGEPGRFLIGDEAAVRGIPVAAEATKLLYDFAFDTLGLERVYGTVVAGNPLMAKWQKYLGMREEGRLRRHYFIDGRFQDAIMFGLLREEYRESMLPRLNALIALAEPAPVG